MALVNPNIAMSFRAPEIQQQNALADYAAVQQIQGGMQAQELNALQMQQARRTEKSQNVLADAYAQATDPATGAIDFNKLTGLVAAGGGGAQLPGIQKARVEQQTALTAQQKAQSDLLDAKLKQSRGFLDTLDPADPTAPARYLAWHEANHKDPVIGAALTARGVSAEQARQNIEAAIAKGPAAFAQMLNQSKLGTEKFMEMNKPITSVGPTGIVQTPGLGGAATIVPGTSAAFQMTPAQIAQNRIAQAQLGVSQGQLSVAQQRAALDVRKLAQDSDPAFVQKMAQAREAGAAAAKDITVATKVLPQVVSSANQTLALIDTMIGKRDEKGNLVKGAAPHPGFEASVGATFMPGARFVPGSDASDFQSYFDQVKGGAFLQAFETLKGGGAITEKEGEKGTAALNRMNLAQSEKEFVTAAREFQDVVRAGVQRAQAKVPGAIAPNIDALLNKYK